MSVNLPEISNLYKKKVLFGFTVSEVSVGTIVFCPVARQHIMVGAYVEVTSHLMVVGVCISSLRAYPK
jgi:hypothetical protein